MTALLPDVDPDGLLEFFGRLHRPIPKPHVWRISGRDARYLSYTEVGLQCR